MRKKLILIVILSLFTVADAAKYAGEPFSLGAGARALGMGGAVIAGPFDGSAGYWNPAGLNYLSGRNIIAMHSETFGSLLNHDFIGFSSKKGEGSSAIQSYGFYFYYLGGGGIKITGFDPQSQRPYVIREESHGDMLLAGSLSGKIKKSIDFGVTGKIIYRDLGTLSGYGLTFDAGALYQLHRKIQLGLVVTDITSGFIRYSGGQTESILPTVKPGVLISHSYKNFTGRLGLSGDIKFEGIKYGAQFWMGEISLDTHVGMELGYREMVFGRFGWDIGNFTAGLGFDIKRIKIDMAYLHNSFLDETFRISGGYQF
jgi:hypothetical protein